MTLPLYADPLSRLQKSKFRRDFGLSEHEKKQVREMGLLQLIEEAEEIIEKKLGKPLLDGRQTPFYGHPVYKAMHATATSSRKALFRWHRIPPHENLCNQDRNYIQKLIVRWIKKQLMSETPALKFYEQGKPMVEA